MAKKQKEKISFKRSKLKEQRLLRLKSIKKEKQKKQNNTEFFNIFKQENIDQLSTKEKIEVMSQLATILISYPETNSDKLSLLLLFLKDTSVIVITKAIEHFEKFFIETIPLHRINEMDYSKQKQKESKEVKKIHSQEKNLLLNYGQFIDDVKLLDQSFSKQKIKDNVEVINLRKKITSTLGKLFEKYYYFNYENKLYNFLIDKLSDDVKEIKEKSFSSLYQVLGKIDNSKNILELKFKMIKKLSEIISSKNHKLFEPVVMDLFSDNKMPLPDYVKENEKNESKIDLSDLKYGGPLANESMNNQEYAKAQRQLKAFNKEKSKIIKSMKKTMSEVEQKDDSKMIYFMNLKILKKILILFFDILKYQKDSNLLGGVFNGISELCEHINIEILLDLQKCVYENIKYLLQNTNKKFSLALSGLNTNLTIAKKLTKEIVSMEDSYLITASYQIICGLINNYNIKEKDKKIFEFENAEDLRIIVSVVEMIILKNIMYSVDTSASFVKRLAMMLIKVKMNQNQIIALLLLIKRILGKYSSLNFLVDNSEEEFDNFDYKNTMDPSLCNGKLTNIIKELNEIKNNNLNNQTIKKLVDYILKGEKVNTEFSSMNYYTYLLKEEVNE